MHRNRKRSPFRRREGLLTLAALIVLTLFIGGTVAFLMDSTEAVENVFEPSDVKCYVDETVSGSEKTAVRIQNSGNIDAYIRVIVSCNHINAEGKICALHPMPQLPAPGSGWSLLENGIYYYSTAVAPGDYTGPLFADAVDMSAASDGCVPEMVIAAGAIQASGGAAGQVW